MDGCTSSSVHPSQPRAGRTVAYFVSEVPAGAGVAVVHKSALKISSFDPATSSYINLAHCVLRYSVDNDILRSSK